MKMTILCLLSLVTFASTSFAGDMTISHQGVAESLYNLLGGDRTAAINGNVQTATAINVVCNPKADNPLAYVCAATGLAPAELAGGVQMSMTEKLRLLAEFRQHFPEYGTGAPIRIRQASCTKTRARSGFTFACVLEH